MSRRQVILGLTALVGSAFAVACARAEGQAPEAASTTAGPPKEPEPELEPIRPTAEPAPATRGGRHDTAALPGARQSEALRVMGQTAAAEFPPRSLGAGEVAAAAAPDPAPSPAPPPITARSGRRESAVEASPVEQNPEAAPPLPAGLASYQSAFLSRAIAPAQRSQAATGVPASVTLAQAILESDWGRSKLATQAHNYFGIKATRKDGPAGTVWMRTYEARVGYVNAPFRAYRDMEESFVDHGRFFFEAQRYEKALRVRDDARAFAREIHRAGYATDPAYSEKLIRLMEKLSLQTYDRSK